MREAKKANLLFTLILWVSFGVASMALMIWTASEKTIVIADASRNQTGNPNAGDGGAQPGGTLPESSLKFRQEENVGNCFWVPLPEGLEPENITVENRYVDRELWLYIENAGQAFFEENDIYGNVSGIETGFCEEQQGQVVLKLHMNGVSEYYSIMENKTLKLTFDRPENLYGQIVVIDPAGGGSETGITGSRITEKELALQVAKYLQQMEISPDIKFYFTRMEDVEVPEHKRLDLIEGVKADMFIRIGAWKDTENTDKYGIQCFYNDDYFIPGFGNIELADAVTRNVTIASSNRALGLFSAPEDSILREIQIPAVELSLGYMSNPKECELLSQENYQEKLAEGIANAVLEVYTGRE